MAVISNACAGLKWKRESWAEINMKMCSLEGERTLGNLMVQPWEAIIGHYVSESRVSVKSPRCQSMRGARARGYLPKRSRDWAIQRLNQPKDRCTLQAARLVRHTHLSPLTQEATGFGVCSAGSWSSFGPEFPPYAPNVLFWNGNVYSSSLYVAST